LRIEIIPAGIGSKPIILEATQVVVKGENGQPVQLAAESGVPGVLLLSNVDDSDFNELLQQVGYDITVICNKLDM
jgi:hypothetical protein